MSNDEEKPVRRPGSWDEMYPGRFLKAGLLKGKPVTLAIKDVTLEELPSDKGGDQVRGVLSFERTPMQLALNKTNGLCLRKMFGNKPMEWIGKRVTFVPEVDKFGSETVDAIRIQGSPDLERALEIEIKMPKRKAKKRRLIVTGKPAQQRQDAPPEQDKDMTVPEPPDTDEREPEPDLSFGQEEAAQ